MKDFKQTFGYQKPLYDQDGRRLTVGGGIAIVSDTRGESSVQFSIDYANSNANSNDNDVSGGNSGASGHFHKRIIPKGSYDPAAGAAAGAVAAAVSKRPKPPVKPSNDDDPDEGVEEDDDPPDGIGLKDGEKSDGGSDGGESKASKDDGGTWGSGTGDPEAEVYLLRNGAETTAADEILD